MGRVEHHGRAPPSGPERLKNQSVRQTGAARSTGRPVAVGFPLTPGDSVRQIEGATHHAVVIDAVGFADNYAAMSLILAGKEPAHSPSDGGGGGSAKSFQFNVL
jgi:hypothetical protein